MSEADVIEHRRRFTTLMRTCLHRLDHRDHPFRNRAEAFDSSWMIYGWESAKIDLNRFWGGEVRPLRWG